MRALRWSAVTFVALLLALLLVPVGAYAIDPAEQGGSVTGAITDGATGDPLAGIEATLLAVNAGELAAITSTTTAENGVFSFPEVSPGAYLVKLRDPHSHYVPAVIGSIQAPLAVTAGGSVVADSAMTRGGRLHGNVSDRRGNPVVGGIVTVYAATGSRPAVESTTTDALGNYSFDVLKPGGYCIRAEDPSKMRAPWWWGGSYDLATAVWTSVAVDGDTAADFVLRIIPYFEGRVADALTDEPIAGARVRIYDASQLNKGYSASSCLVREVETDANGRYLVTELSNRLYVVAFCDMTGQYRDVTFPQTGLPVEWAPSVSPEGWTDSVDCWMLDLGTFRDARARRIAGADRYLTSIEVCRANFDTADTAVVVSGASFPDALSAAPLAGIVEGPLLLAAPRGAPDAVLDELDRLGVTKVYIVGGVNSVPDAIAKAITGRGFTVERIAGADRYDTSARVAVKAKMLGAGNAPFLCRGDSFADALSVSPFAYMDGRPILLTTRRYMPEPVRKVWERNSEDWENTVIIVGGTNSVGDTVVQQLANYSWGGGVYYARISGANRYETCQKLIEAFQGPTWKFAFIGVTSGLNYADALGGGAAAGYNWGPLVLTDPNSLSAPARKVIAFNGPWVLNLQGYGGMNALSDPTFGAAENALGTTSYDIDAGFVTFPTQSAAAPGGFVGMLSSTPAGAAGPASEGARPTFSELDYIEVRAE